MKPVAITAVGVVCAVGDGPAQVLDALRAHRSGLAPLSWPLPAAHVAPVPVSIPDLPEFPDDRKVALLARAAAQVLGGITAPPERRGAFLGTGLSSVTPRELEEEMYPHLRDGRIDPDAVIADLSSGVAPRRHLPERATAWLMERMEATGPSGTTFSACAAGAEAIAAGARAVARGEADVVVAGGHDAMIHPLGLVSFEVLGALSGGLARPFDRRRDGFVLGEGAALLRMEPLETAVNPLAVILGAGSSLDAHGITAPHPDGRGAEDSMRRALRDAGVSPDRVGWVNAHGTATPLGDAAEARAIARVFGPDVAVSSLKGAVGHTLAAAGAVEAAATVLALGAGFVPGTVGCEEPDDLGVRVLTAPVEDDPGVVVSNSFGFGGQNASLVFARRV